MRSKSWREVDGDDAGLPGRRPCCAQRTRGQSEFGRRPTGRRMRIRGWPRPPPRARRGPARSTRRPSRSWPAPRVWVRSSPRPSSSGSPSNGTATWSGSGATPGSGWPTSSVYARPQPLAGLTFVITGSLPGFTARQCDRGGDLAWRQGGFVGVEADRLRGRRRERRLQGRAGYRAGPPGAGRRRLRGPARAGPGGGRRGGEGGGTESSRTWGSVHPGPRAGRRRPRPCSAKPAI